MQEKDLKHVPPENYVMTLVRKNKKKKKKKNKTNKRIKNYYFILLIFIFIFLFIYLFISFISFIFIYLLINLFIHVFFLFFLKKDTYGHIQRSFSQYKEAFETYNKCLKFQEKQGKK